MFGKRNEYAYFCNMFNSQTQKWYEYEAIVNTCSDADG